jgi:hypothetical protein
MSLNLSGLCATTKLIQCQMYGVNSVEVSRKFDKNPDEVSDLSKDDFLARKKVLRQVEKWCEFMKSKPDVIPENTWRLINYHYEVCKVISGKLFMLMGNVDCWLKDREVFGYSLGKYIIYSKMHYVLNLSFRRTSATCYSLTTPSRVSSSFWY